MPRDINHLAKAVVEMETAEPATDQALPPADAVSQVEPTPAGKNPAAVALGRLGGLKGGPARKAKLSAKRRSEIARKAARARWAKPEG